MPHPQHLVDPGAQILQSSRAIVPSGQVGQPGRGPGSLGRGPGGLGRGPGSGSLGRGRFGANLRDGRDLGPQDVDFTHGFGQAIQAAPHGHRVDSRHLPGQVGQDFTHLLDVRPQLVEAGYRAVQPLHDQGQFLLALRHHANLGAQPGRTGAAVVERPGRCQLLYLAHQASPAFIRLTLTPVTAF